jgi:threonine dehydratase
MTLNPCSITLSDIKDAAKRIKSYANRTPVMTCATLDKMAGSKLFFKCEQFQKVGAFKFRGACNAVMKLTSEQAEKGVVTHSSGNHAQALALAAKLRGVQAFIVMPEGAPAVKRNAVLGYGAHVITCANSVKSREETAEKVQRETGATFIHPYDTPAVIEGQGTVALELLDDVPTLDAIIAPVGGGGLISGICLAAKSINPQLRIFAAEPLGADDAARSMAAGYLIPQTNPQTIADGLRTSLGQLTWPIIRKYVEKVITVSEDEIKSAMRLIWERMKVVTEPSAAVALAAVLKEEFKALKIPQIGVVFSGGNIDLDEWKWK